MSVCSACGSAGIVNDIDLCAYHSRPDAEDWAAGNRIMCNFLHRGIIPKRIDEKLRWEGDEDPRTSDPAEFRVVSVTDSME